jgi:hypothetical protein
MTGALLGGIGFDRMPTGIGEMSLEAFICSLFVLGIGYLDA